MKPLLITFMLVCSSIVLVESAPAYASHSHDPSLTDWFPPEEDDLDEPGHSYVNGEDISHQEGIWNGDGTEEMEDDE